MFAEAKLRLNHSGFCICSFHIIYCSPTATSEGSEGVGVGSSISLAGLSSWCRTTATISGALTLVNFASHDTLSGWFSTTATIAGVLKLANIASDVGQAGWFDIAGWSWTAVTISGALTLDNFVSHVLRGAVTIASALTNFTQHCSLIA